MVVVVVSVWTMRILSVSNQVCFAVNCRGWVELSVGVVRTEDFLYLHSPGNINGSIKSIGADSIMTSLTPPLVRLSALFLNISWKTPSPPANVYSAASIPTSTA